AKAKRAGQPDPLFRTQNHTPRSISFLSRLEVAMTSKVPSFTASFLLLLILASAQNLFAQTNPETLALKAVSENSAESAPAIAKLRALGPAGLDTLFQTYSSEIDEQVAN